MITINDLILVISKNLLDCKITNMASSLFIAILIYLKKTNNLIYLKKTNNLIYLKKTNNLIYLKKTNNNKLFVFIKEIGFLIILIYFTNLLLFNEISNIMQNNNLLLLLYTYAASLIITNTNFVSNNLNILNFNTSI